MSINIETSALSMSKSLDSLETTPLVMHRIWVEIEDTQVWYSVMKELNLWFGKNWRGQPRVKRKFAYSWSKTTQRVWFDVPDPSCATWLGVKLAVSVTSTPNK